MVSNWVTWENCLWNWVPFLFKVHFFPPFWTKECKRRVVPACVLRWPVCPICPYKGGHACIYGHLWEIARIFVILPVFWWFSAGFNALLSCLANRSITLWSCTKSQKNDGKITKTWILPVFLSKKCSYFARNFTKMNLFEELGTLVHFFMYLSCMYCLGQTLSLNICFQSVSW